MVERYFIQRNKSAKVYIYIRSGSTITQKMKFSTTDSSVNVTKSADLVAFTEEIRNEKLHFLCSVLTNLFDGHDRKALCSST